MECAECDRLMAECERVGQSYATTMKALIDRRETASSSTYIQMRTATDEARSGYEVARLELERHKMAHAV